VGIQSSARFWGRLTPTAVGLLFLGTALLLLCVGLTLQLQLSYYLTLVVASAGWIWQTWKLHQVDHSATLYPTIFRQNVAQGFLLLAGMIMGSLL
jgi:4-hydroxybenzoate polyprenyltransferase